MRDYLKKISTSSYLLLFFIFMNYKLGIFTVDECILWRHISAMNDLYNATKYVINCKQISNIFRMNGPEQSSHINECNDVKKLHKNYE
jgi:hypothetical protein